MRQSSLPVARIALGLLAALAAPITVNAARAPQQNSQQPGAQQPGPQQPGAQAPGAQSPGDAPAAAAAAAKSAADGSAAAKGPPTLTFAKVTADDVALRCFASPRSPVYQDKLSKGAVLAVERAEGDFRRVVLPQGPTGYVHANFASAPGGAGEGPAEGPAEGPEVGIVVTKGDNVSFRYRPQSAEAPVEMLPPGVQLFYLGREGRDGEWLKVRHPQGPAWIEASALEVFTGEPAALEAQAKELQKVRDQEWRDATAALAQEQAAQKAAVAARTRVDELAAAFRTEAGKPTELQEQARLVALESEVAEVAAKLQSAQDQGAAQLLQSEIKKQRLLLEARAVASAPPPPAAPMATIGTPTVHDPLARFDAVGWLTRAGSASGLQQFRLEKGGRVLYYVTCQSGRYDLRLFEGIEVGISGTTDRVDRQSAWLLDAQRIEVLGAAR